MISPLRKFLSKFRKYGEEEIKEVNSAEMKSEIKYSPAPNAKNNEGKLHLKIRKIESEIPDKIDRNVFNQQTNNYNIAEIRGKNTDSDLALKILCFPCYAIYFILSRLYYPTDMTSYMRRYGILFLDLRPGVRFFDLFFLSRVYVFVIFLVILYNFAFPLTLTLLVLCIFFILIVLCLHPFNFKPLMLFYILMEIFFFFGVLGCFLLALQDQKGVFIPEKRLSYGWLIVFSYILLIFAIIISALISICKSFATAMDEPIFVVPR